MSTLYEALERIGKLERDLNYAVIDIMHLKNKDLEFEIAKLELNKDDVLVFKAQKELTAECLSGLNRIVIELKLENRAILLEQGIELEKLNISKLCRMKEQIDKLIKEYK